MNNTVMDSKAWRQNLAIPPENSSSIISQLTGRPKRSDQTIILGVPVWGKTALRCYKVWAASKTITHVRRNTRALAFVVQNHWNKNGDNKAMPKLSYTLGDHQMRVELPFNSLELEKNEQQRNVLKGMFAKLEFKNVVDRSRQSAERGKTAQRIPLNTVRPSRRTKRRPTIEQIRKNLLDKASFNKVAKPLFKRPNLTRHSTPKPPA